MSDVSTDTLRAWRESLLAACHALASALANVRGITEGQAWHYQPWMWEGPLLLAHLSTWGREVQVLAGLLEDELVWTHPPLSDHQQEESAYDHFVKGMLSTWSELEDTEAAAFEELGDVLPLVRQLARAHRLVGLAHKRVNAGIPCNRGPTRVGASYILPVVDAMVREMVVATSHLAQPCHTGAAGEWRDRVEAELRSEMEGRYRDHLEDLAQERDGLAEALQETVELGVQHVLANAVPGVGVPDDPPLTSLQLAVGGPSGVVNWQEDDSGSECFSTPPSTPPRRLPVGGPAGMFSPRDKIEQEEELGDAAPTGGLPRTPVPARRPAPAEGLSGKATRVKVRREEEVRQEEAAMAASDLFGPQREEAKAESESDRIRSLEAQVNALTKAVGSLLELARGMRAPVETPLSPPRSTTPRPDTDATGVTGEEPDVDLVLPSTADEVTALKLRQDRRKERLTVLKVLLPWAKHLAVLLDKTPVLRPALHRLYGPPTYCHAGEVAALEDAIKMYRAMAYPTSSPGATGPLTFRFTPLVAVALVHFRVGGPMRDSEPLYLRTLDLVPLAEGEERRLAHVDESMFAMEPVWAERRAPTTITAFRDCGLRMAQLLGLHWGPRCQYELTATVEALHDKGMRSPTVMTPSMACHLLDLLITTVVGAVYEEARGRPPLPVGTDALTPALREQYRAKGWCLDGPTFRASMQSEFMVRWWREPLQEAALSDPSRRTTAMRLMGMDQPASKPPKGGPTGGSSDAPGGEQPPTPSPRLRANFTVEEATAAAASLPGTRAPAEQVCMRYLSAKGCQRGPKCRFTHIGVTAGQLRECARTSPPLQKILAFFGGPSTRTLVAQSTQASPPAPQAGRSGGCGGESASDSDSSSEDDLPGPLARGGKASGGTEVQVPYLLALGDCYTRAPRDDDRSAVPRLSLCRPPTVHPDAPATPFSGAIDLTGVYTPALAPLRAGGRPAVVVSPTSPGGSFTVRLGALILHGQDAGQDLVVGTTTISNACVVLSFASVLQLPPADLFTHLVTAAQAAAASLGPPSRLETATVVLLRTFCHDILASWARGHPLDALIFLYFPHPALLRAVVVVVHTQGSTVAIDVLRGPLADASTPLLGCLQRRGTPGHMQPLSLPPFTLAELEAWAADHLISVRLLDIQSWQDWLASDPACPSTAWMAHRMCDFCASPRFPLPPTAL